MVDFPFLKDVQGRAIVAGGQICRNIHF